MRSTLFTRHKERSLAGALALSFGLSLGLSAIPLTPVWAQTPAKSPGKAWVVPRTPDGKPDLQGNWTNETQTPFERMGNQGPTLTDEQAAALEKRAKDVAEFGDRPVDPNEKAEKGGVRGNDLAAVPGEPTFVERIAQAAGGNVGGYNSFWLDPGQRVIRVNGVARSSILIDPPNGRIPALTEAGKRLAAENGAQTRRLGRYDGPEGASLSDRCLTSFGSNAGPPMLPNYFYNNNYTIVQTKDHVVILTEMVHDARIIRLGAKEHLPAQIRPWYGDSIGHWEGDTLVVETTNINPTQLAQGGGMSSLRGASDKLKITERFTRSGPDVLLYKFTVEDPVALTAPYSGELPFNRINEAVHEYACHEGNYALPAMLAGARQEDKAREQKK
jgi:hypothetical protein